MAGVGPKDVDAAMIYDAFSPHVYIGLESLELCPGDEVKEFVQAQHWFQDLTQIGLE